MREREALPAFNSARDISTTITTECTGSSVSLAFLLGSYEIQALLLKKRVL